MSAHAGATLTRMHVPKSWMPCSWQVHRDLATRNVLVSDADRCLICDSGMSRGVRAELDTGNDAYYVMQHDGRLPVRWLAPEAMSMERKKFSEASDVYVGPRLLAFNLRLVFGRLPSREEAHISTCTLGLLQPAGRCCGCRLP